MADSETQGKPPFVLTDEMRQEIAGAGAEIDLELAARDRLLTPAERVEIAADMIAAAEHVGVYRLRQREPHLSEDEAYRIIRGGLLNYERSKRK